MTPFKGAIPKTVLRGQARYLKALVLVFLLLLLVITWAYIEDSHTDPSLTYPVETEVIDLSAESFLIIITSAFVAVATRYFIMPITLYVRGRSQWEWDPGPIAFWTVITKGIALYFTELSAANSNLSSYMDVLSAFFNSIFVIFLTLFLLRSYLHYFVPFLSKRLSTIETDTQYGPILEIIGSITIIIFGLAKFLDQFDVDIGVLLAGIGSQVLLSLWLRRIPSVIFSQASFYCLTRGSKWETWCISMAITVLSEILVCVPPSSTT